MKSLIDKNFEKYLLNENIKYISFDIFDTLIFRKVNEPTDIFELMGQHKYIKNIFENSINFRNLRVNAEQIARKKSLQKEISIDEIYEQFIYLTKKQQKKIRRIELETEKNNLFINKKIEKWIDLAIKHNKEIIFVSDMYLNEKQIRKIILKKLKNIENIKEIFVSSDLKKTKYDGSMYEYILNKHKINSNQILHIGDNFLSDILQANTQGISTILYKQDYMYLEQLKHEKSYYGFSQNTISLRNIASLNNGYKNEKYQFFYNFGATIIAPIFWAFSIWLMKLCLKKGLFSVGFMLREGDIFKKYFEKVIEYYGVKEKFILKNIYISRKALLLSTLMEEDYNLDFNDSKFCRDVTLGDFYKRFKLTIDNPEFKEYENEKLNNLGNLQDIIKEDLYSKLPKIYENKRVENDFFLEYWKNLNLDENSIIFDFGANATIHKKLYSLLPNYNYKSILFYRTKQGFENSIYQEQHTFIPYDQENAFKIDLLRRSPDIFEILFNGLLGTTLGYEKKGERVVPTIDKQDTIQDKRIIKSFIKGIDDYFKVARKYKQKKSSFTSNDILNLLTRVIEFPTYYEAKYLGELQINTSDDASNLISIVSNKSIEKLKQNNLNEVLQNLRNDLYRDWVDIPWIQGTITHINLNYLKNKYLSDNPNQSFINHLLEQIDDSYIKEFSVYGVGEFFLQLLPELILKGIKIKYLIETKPKQSKAFGYEVLSLSEIVKTEQKNFIIASAAFSLVMKKELEFEFKLAGKEIDNVFSVY